MTRRASTVPAGNRSRARWLLLAAGLLCGTIFGLGVETGRAQVPYQVGDGNPNVTVDLGVLDQLGPAQNVPGLLNQRLRNQFGMPGAAPSRRAPAYPGAAPRAGLGVGATGMGGAVIGRAPQVPGWLRRDGATPGALPYAAPQMSGTGRVRPYAPPAAAPRPPLAASAPTLRPPRQTGSAAATPRQPEPSPDRPPSETGQTVAASQSAEDRGAPPAPRTPPPPPSTPPAESASGAADASARASAPPPPPTVPETPDVAPPPAGATDSARDATAEDRSAPARQEPPQETAPQVASAPADTQAPAAASAPSDQGTGLTRLIFPAGESQLPDAAKAAMEPLITRLKADEDLRLQLRAYAAAGEESANTARRLSLSRALAVRAHLIDNDIQSTRMNVRALGDRAEDGPADRVDLVVVE